MMTLNRTDTDRREETPNGPAPAWLRQVMDAVAGLEYGQVLITVHRGKVSEVAKTERHRFEE
jgi:hypothetical protein